MAAPPGRQARAGARATRIVYRAQRARYIPRVAINIRRIVLNLVCVFSTQFSILIIVGLIGPNRAHIPEYIGIRLGPRYFQPRATGCLGIFDWKFLLKKSTGYLWSIEICTWAPGHKFSMTTARLSTCRARITQRSMGFSTRTMSYLNESADLSVLSLVSQVPGFKSRRQSGVNC